MYEEPGFDEQDFAPGTTEVSDEAPKYPSAVNVSLDMEAICIGIRGEIVQATARELFASLKYDLQKDTRAAVKHAIDRQLSAIVVEALAGKVRPTDEWGNPTGEPSTVRDLLREKAAKFLDEKVDSSGDVTSYSGQPRWKWAASSLVSSQVEKALKSELASVVAAMRERLQDELPGILAERKR